MVFLKRCLQQAHELVRIIFLLYLVETTVQFLLSLFNEKIRLYLIEEFDYLEMDMGLL